MATQVSKKRKFVADGVFKAELNEFLTRELAEDGYSGVEVRVTPTRTEIIIMATRTQNVLGEKGRRIRELTSVVQKRFNFPEGTVELYAEKVNIIIPIHIMDLTSCLQIGRHPWSVCYCPSRVSPLQADWRSRREEGLLWCPQVHHGERGQGM